MKNKKWLYVIGCFTGNDLKIAKKVSDHLPVVARFNVDDEFRDRE